MASPSWVILATVPRVSDDLPPAADLSLALVAPPRVAHLTLGPRVSPADPDPQARLASPCILAADPSSGCFLALAPPSVADRPPTRPRVHTGPDGVERTLHIGRVPDPSCFILDVPAATASRVPDPDRVAFNWADLGVIAATLTCYSSKTGKWVDKDVRNPEPDWIWNFEHVISHNGKLWWVDTAAGLLSCDPFPDHPDMAFVPLPGEGGSDDDELLEEGQNDDDELLGGHGCCSYCAERDAGSRRHVMLSNGKFRCVEMSCAHQGGAPTFAVHTLADPETAEWTLEYEVCFAEIWADGSYKAAGLPEKAPVVALIHPTNPDVLYFFVDEFLFGVDMRAKKVVECVAHELHGPAAQGGVSSSCVLAWELPTPGTKTTWWRSFCALGRSVLGCLPIVSCLANFAQRSRKGAAAHAERSRLDGVVSEAGVKKEEFGAPATI
ncbi:hypothetical protein ACP70R_030784 [Stipagrostis hirtigluma subsp. patula]